MKPAPVTSDPMHRAAMALLWMGGFDTAEIARRLGLTEATVYNTRAHMKSEWFDAVGNDGSTSSATGATVGRDHNPTAVRKAEARSPGASHSRK